MLLNRLTTVTYPWASMNRCSLMTENPEPTAITWLMHLWKKNEALLYMKTALRWTEIGIDFKTRLLPDFCKAGTQIITHHASSLPSLPSQYSQDLSSHCRASSDFAFRHSARITHIGQPYTRSRERKEGQKVGRQKEEGQKEEGQKEEGRLLCQLEQISKGKYPWACRTIAAPLSCLRSASWKDDIETYLFLTSLAQGGRAFLPTPFRLQAWRLIHGHVTERP